VHAYSYCGHAIHYPVCAGLQKELGGSKASHANLTSQLAAGAAASAAAPTHAQLQSQQMDSMAAEFAHLPPAERDAARRASVVRCALFDRNSHLRMDTISSHACSLEALAYMHDH
jgi:hypothetical protein